MGTFSCCTINTTQELMEWLSLFTETGDGSPPSSQNKVFPQERWQEVSPGCGSVCLLKQEESGCSEEGFIVCAPSEVAPAGRTSPLQLWCVGLFRRQGSFQLLSPGLAPGPYTFGLGCRRHNNKLAFVKCLMDYTARLCP